MVSLRGVDAVVWVFLVLQLAFQTVKDMTFVAARYRFRAFQALARKREWAIPDPAGPRATAPSLFAA
ncbi:hypothetical protein CONPUDRAFT_82624 [Coniophora puteana RWD-64-598 SS2]|uniref:Uncharacterized protein n=1 Tax=Coniophora puteana (strain RWD-64-598) TaxID=741705 RepID=A0A5M3MMW6_CONPW|nr:uncharacterized protein CONPUDRAFT_82624 [Coniophora puteana RWD-64-598 SS2]EIW80360.1 hypothetical protein CONPUDRAFT_82624 [Coniophora puteana RWD-64-598 SS2]